MTDCTHFLYGTVFENYCYCFKDDCGGFETLSQYTTLDVYTPWTGSAASSGPGLATNSPADNEPYAYETNKCVNALTYYISQSTEADQDACEDECVANSAC
jgi:hypothetical protein